MKPKKKTSPDQAREDLRAFIAIRLVDARLREEVPGVFRSGKASDTVLIHQGGARWGVNVPRLHEIEEALFRGNPIDDALREELRAVVAVLAYQQEALLAKRPGPRVNPDQRAAVVLHLHRKYEVKLEAAIGAVARQDGTEEERRKDRQNVERAYYKLAAKDGYTVRVLNYQIAAALDLLKIPHDLK